MGKNGTLHNHTNIERRNVMERFTKGNL